jgi:hypothetical protein
MIEKNNPKLNLSKTEAQKYFPSAIFDASKR